MSDHRPMRSENEEFEDWVRLLDRVPFVGAIKRDFTALRRLLYDRRAPRLAILGADESGKTSLANALLNALTFGPEGVAPAPHPGQWMRIDADGRRLDWLELPADAEPGALLEMAHEAFEDSPPDLLIGVVEAGDDKATAARVRDAMMAVRKHAKKKHGGAPTQLLLLTKVDVLPPSAEAPPYSDAKRHAIDFALEELASAMKSAGLEEQDIFPICARPYDSEPESPRYNIDGVGEAILARLPDAAKMEAVRAFHVGSSARRDVARALVNSCATLAITIGIAPVPFADAFILLPMQAGMVSGIAYLSGRPWDRKAAAEWIGSVGAVGGAGLGLRWGAQQLVKFIPGAGSIVGASVAGAGTLAIGRSAMAYFLDGPGGPRPRAELRADNP